MDLKIKQTFREKSEVNLHNLGQGKQFLVPKSIICEKIDKLDLIKIKSICSVKDSIKKMKGWLQSGRKYVQTTSPTKCIL